MTREEDEEAEYKLAKAVNRGNLWTKYGYDPGDDEPTNGDAVLYGSLFLLLAVGYVWRSFF